MDEKMFMGILNVIRSDNILSFNKALARRIGVSEAIVYSMIVAKYFYWKDKGRLTQDGYFFYTIEDMEQDTTLSRKTQKRAVDNLGKIGLIKMDRRGANGVRHFQLVPVVDMLLDLVNVPNGLPGTSHRDEQECPKWTNPGIATERPKGTIGNVPSGRTGMSETDKLDSPIRTNRVATSVTENEIKDEPLCFKGMSHLDEPDSPNGTTTLDDELMINDDDEDNKAVQEFEKWFGFINQNVRMLLMQHVDVHGVDVVAYAVEVAGKNAPANPISYIGKLLDDWSSQGLGTTDKIQEYLENRSKRRFRKTTVKKVEPEKSAVSEKDKDLWYWLNLETGEGR